MEWRGAGFGIVALAVGALAASVLRAQEVSHDLGRVRLGLGLGEGPIIYGLREYGISVIKTVYP